MPGWLRVSAEGGAGLSDGIAWAGGGLEVMPARMFALRAGYRLPLADQVYGGLSGVTAGAGFRLGNLTLDYAFEPLGDLATGHLVTLSWRKPSWVPFEAEAGRMERKLLNVAVMDMTGQNVGAGDAAVITDLLRGELVKTRKFNVLERGNMERVLAEQAFQQTGCTSDDCAVKLGKLLNCQRMVSGSLGKLAAEYYLNVRVVDIETGRVVWSDSVGAKYVKDLTKQLPDLAQRMAKKLN
jgi:TolB-like protein